VRQCQEVLAEAEDGEGWSYWLDRLVQDYVVTDMGGVSELGRDGERGPVTGLYNLDAAALRLTGNTEVPIRYYPRVGNSQGIPLEPDDFFRVIDMPSPEENRFGLGFSAVSRAPLAVHTRRPKSCWHCINTRMSNWQTYRRRASPASPA